MTRLPTIEQREQTTDATTRALAEIATDMEESCSFVACMHAPRRVALGENAHAQMRFARALLRASR